MRGGSEECKRKKYNTGEGGEESLKKERRLEAKWGWLAAQSDFHLLFESVVLMVKRGD